MTQTKSSPQPDSQSKRDRMNRDLGKEAPSVRQRIQATTLRLVITTLLCLAAVFAPGRPLLRAYGPAQGAASCPAVASTPTFSLAYGRALLDDVDAPVGTVVEAISPRGDVVGCIEVTTAGHFGLLRIYGEDTTLSPAIPGMREGEAVAFRMLDNAATATPAFVWHADRESHEVALAGSATPTAVPCNTLTTDASPPEGGSVGANPPHSCMDDPSPGRHAPGTQVQIQAAPAFGYRFSHWSGEIRGNTNPITLIMDQDRTFIAHFAPVETNAIYLPMILGAPQ